jgi:uncharacterized membrane protein YfcA
MDLLLPYLLLGALAGLLAGMLGIGGGLVTVPALSFLLPADGVPQAALMQLAIGTSMAAMTLTTAVSAYAHHRYGTVQWNTWRRLAPALVVGSVGGALVADYLPSNTLSLIFGIGEILLALQLALDIQPRAPQRLPRVWAMRAAGLVIGAACSLLGIGGGLLVVPYLLWHGMAIKQAVSTAAATGVAIAWAGAATYLFAGMDAPVAGLVSVGHVHLFAFAAIALGSIFAAPLGARLAHTLPARLLRRIFAVFIALLGVLMIAGR